MKKLSSFLLIILLVNRGQASSPFQVHPILSNGLEILSRILQNNTELPISFLFDNMKMIFSQERTTPPKGEEDDTPSLQTGLWQTVFQSLGFKSKQFPDIALNILMFLIKIISTSLSPTQTNYSRDFEKKDTPLLNMILEQPQVSRLMSQMQDPGLMVNVLKEAESKLGESPSDCPIQLMCRSTPVVRGMQKSLAFFLRQREHKVENRTKRGETDDEEIYKESDLKNLDSKWGRLSPLQRFFFFMPSFHDFLVTSSLCRRKYPNC